MTEIWKDIPGYEGRYQASNLGRIKSLERKVRSVNRYTRNDFFRTVPERILRPGQQRKTGHLSVVLGRGTCSKPVHQLVARAFLGTVPENNEVLHNNGNPTDNRVENLRYGTRRENIMDVYFQGGRWKNYRLMMFMKSEEWMLQVKNKQLSPKSLMFRFRLSTKF